MKYSKESTANYTKQLSAQLKFHNYVLKERTKTRDTISKWAKYNLTTAKGKSSRGRVVGFKTDYTTEQRGINTTRKKIVNLRKRIYKLQKLKKINRII